MCDHVMIPIDPPLLTRQIDPPLLTRQIDPPPLVRQNAFTPRDWEKLFLNLKPPAPSEAFLPQEWDIEKGRF